MTDPHILNTIQILTASMNDTPYPVGGAYTPRAHSPFRKMYTMGYCSVFAFILMQIFKERNPVVYGLGSCDQVVAEDLWPMINDNSWSHYVTVIDGEAYDANGVYDMPLEDYISSNQLPANITPEFIDEHRSKYDGYFRVKHIISVDLLIQIIAESKYLGPLIHPQRTQSNEKE